MSRRSLYHDQIGFTTDKWIVQDTQVNKPSESYKLA